MTTKAELEDELQASENQCCEMEAHNANLNREIQELTNQRASADFKADKFEKHLNRCIDDLTQAKYKENRWDQFINYLINHGERPLDELSYGYLMKLNAIFEQGVICADSYDRERIKQDIRNSLDNW